VKKYPAMGSFFQVCTLLSLLTYAKVQARLLLIRLSTYRDASSLYLLKIMGFVG